MNSFDLFGNPSSGKNLREDSRYQAHSYVESVPDLEATVEEDIQERRSFPGIIVAGTLLMLALAGQCFQLQVQNGSQNRALAEGNSIRILTTQPDRGLITDANGQVLAHNTRQLALVINPQGLPKKKTDRQTVYDLIMKKAGVTQESIDFIEKNRLEPGGGEPFAVKINLTKEESLLYEEWFTEVQGLTLQEVAIRQYAAVPSLGQLVGYVGAVSEKDVKEGGYTINQRIGKTGLEETYNKELLGTPGKQKVEINARGEEVRKIPGGTEAAAKPGQTLKLSVDTKLQQIVADALKHEIERRTKRLGPHEKFGASAVVVDPNTGAIKAMVSLPDYDANLFARGISKTDYNNLLANVGNPLLNRAIQGQYPPGSVVKPLIASAGLQEGVINRDTSWVTPYSINIGDFTFIDWTTRHSNYSTDVKRAIAESNDVFFYAMGGGWQERNMRGLGIDKMNEYLGKFGLGNPVGIDIDGEVKGLLGNDAYKQKTFKEKWYIGDTYHSSIGQGYTLTTPLQMAVATAAVANGGTVWQPSIGHSFIDPVTGQETLIPHKVLQQGFVSTENIKTIQAGMRETVTYGSSRPLNNLKVTSAGKTGTAQFGANNENEHAWYVGYAPYENPEIAFSILIEGGGDSFYSSVPVAEEILRGYFNQPLQPGEKLFAEPNLANTEFQGEH